MYVLTGAAVPEDLERTLVSAVGRDKWAEALNSYLMVAIGGEAKKIEILLRLGAQTYGSKNLDCPLWEAVVRYRYFTRFVPLTRAAIVMLLGHHKPHDFVKCNKCVQPDLVQSLEYEFQYLTNPLTQIPVLSCVLAGMPFPPKSFADSRLPGSKIDDQTHAIYNHATSPAVLQRAAFEIMRHRMTTMCIGLQDLELPALLTVFIIEAACCMPGTKFCRFQTWSLATIVKHWRDRRSAPRAKQVDAN